MSKKHNTRHNRGRSAYPDRPHAGPMESLEVLRRRQALTRPGRSTEDLGTLMAQAWGRATGEEDHDPDQPE